MATIFVFYIYEIASPRRIIDTEFKCCFSSAGLQFTTGYGGNGTIVDVSAERLVAVFPPPTPTDAVYLIFQVGTVHRLSLRINGHDIKDVVFIRFDIFSFRLIQIDSYVRYKWGERNALCIDAGVSSRFEYPGGEGRIQHTRCICCCRNFQRDSCFSFRIKYAIEHIRFNGCEIRSRIVEYILSVVLELRVYFGQRHFHFSFQFGGSGSRQPRRSERNSDIFVC